MTPEIRRTLGRGFGGLDDLCFFVAYILSLRIDPRVELSFQLSVPIPWDWNRNIWGSA